MPGVCPARCHAAMRSAAVTTVPGVSRARRQSRSASRLRPASALLGAAAAVPGVSPARRQPWPASAASAHAVITLLIAIPHGHIAVAAISLRPAQRIIAGRKHLQVPVFDVPIVVSTDGKVDDE